MIDWIYDRLSIRCDLFDVHDLFIKCDRLYQLNVVYYALNAIDYTLNVIDCTLNVKCDRLYMNCDRLYIKCDRLGYIIYVIGVLPQ